MKKPIVIFGNTFILKRNPWYSRRLVGALARIGKTPKKAEYILASPPPWAGRRYEAMSREQLEVLRRFSEVSSRTAGMRIEQRIEQISRELKRGRKPRPSRVKPAGTRFHEIFPAVARPAPVPAPLRVE